jgi:hypothetical protein
MVPIVPELSEPDLEPKFPDSKNINTIQAITSSSLNILILLAFVMIPSL